MHFYLEGCSVSDPEDMKTIRKENVTGVRVRSSGVYAYGMYR